MPIHNGATYLGEAIRSLVSQDLEGWELIAIDDGSRDQSREIVRSFGDPRITLIEQDQRGAAAARNRALELASGEFIVFLDADDLLLPGALASNAGLLDAHPSDGVVYGDGFFCDATGRPVERFSTYCPGEPRGDVWETLIITPFLCAPCALMTRRSAISQRELHFDESLTIGEDWDFFIRLAEHSAFVRNPAPVCKYRIHGANVSITASQRRARDLETVRIRTLRSDRFLTASQLSRAQLIYQLLFDCYADQPLRQHQLMSSPSCQLLDGRQHGRLLSLVAAHWILHGWFGRESLEYLRRARALCAGDPRVSVLLLTASISLRLAGAGLRLTRSVRGRFRGQALHSPFSLAQASRAG
jgi:GT2 family glycosyltransferase